MVSLSLPAHIEQRPPRLAPATQDVLLVAGFGHPIAEDYLVHARRTANLKVQTSVGSDRVASVVLFLGERLTPAIRAGLDALTQQLTDHKVEFVAVVSTFQVHLGDRDAIEAEEFALSRLKGLSERVVVFRPGYVLSSSSPTTKLLRRYGACFPLVPNWLQHCFVEDSDLFTAIDKEQAGHGPRQRVMTILGPGRPWREVLAVHRRRGVDGLFLTALSGLFALLLLGHVAFLFLSLFLRRRALAKRWHLSTLRPSSMRELLELCNPYNHRHIKVVGYNNGVNHFGQRYPGRTVVSTVHINRIVRAGPDSIRVDCGTTIRKALDFLAESNQELPVVPNFSYVCLGTAYFVPIHGSASDYSTVADTIAHVVLYDPSEDRLIAASRDEPAYRQHLYNLRSDLLLLRMTVKVKPKARYFVHREVLEQPSAADILAALQDQQAANVEVRKGKAESRKVGLSRYYTGQTPANSPALELPRDTLGHLWDRLEENALTAFLMHGATRYFAWHVELFFTAEEFVTFWEAHESLPLKKIQLRYIRRDGFPNSPFRDHDCVSVDTFMLRRHRRKLEAFLRRTFPVVRFNPGKHSR